MSDFVLANGVSILALVLGLVQFIKSQIPGIEGPKATALALLVGVLFGVGYKLLPFVDPAYLPWVQAVIEGVAFGMGAAGLYKLGKDFTAPADVAPGYQE